MQDLWSFGTSPSVSNNLCGKLILSLESTCFDDTLKVSAFFPFLLMILIDQIETSIILHLQCSNESFYIEAK